MYSWLRRSRTGTTSVPSVILGASILLATFVSPGLAGARQSDETPGVIGDSYESPTYGFSLEWDDRDWEIVGAESSDEFDQLVLTNGSSTLYVSGVAEYDGDPEACNIEVSALVATNRGVREYPSEAGNAALDSSDLTYLVDCRELVAGEAVLLIVHLFPTEALGDEVSAVQDVTETIDLSSDSGGRNGEELAGVDGNAYESPTYGYSLEWDEDVWEVTKSSSENGVDVINLVDDGSSLIISGYTGFDDLVGCIDAAVDFYENEPDVEDWAPYEDEDGDPIARERRTYAYAAFEYVSLGEDGKDDLQLVNYIECRSIGEDGFLLISHLVPERTYDDESELRDELFDTLTLPDGEE